MNFKVVTQKDNQEPQSSILVDDFVNQHLLFNIINSYAKKELLEVYAQFDDGSDWEPINFFDFLDLVNEHEGEDLLGSRVYYLYKNLWVITIPSRDFVDICTRESILEDVENTVVNYDNE